MNRQDVYNYIHEIDELNRDVGGDCELLPKRAVVRRCRGNYIEGLKEGSEYVLGGTAYSARNDILGTRTVFRPDPVTDEIGEERYIEIKGYGHNGKVMFFQEHCENDLFYAMYLESAENEYSLLERAWKLGLIVPEPVALLEIPEDEYFNQGMMGLRERIKTDMMFREIGETGLSRFFGDRYDIMINDAAVSGNGRREVFYWIAEEITKRLREIGRENKSQILEELEKLYPDKVILPPETRITGLMGDKIPGYVIRAPKSPFRVGCPSTKLKTQENIQKAKRIGETYRALLENGVLHYCPSTGNWTTVGELTDFADALVISTEKERMMRIMHEYCKKDDLVGMAEDLIGPRHTTDLSPYFIEGIFGEMVPLRDAARMIANEFLM